MSSLGWRTCLVVCALFGPWDAVSLADARDVPVAGEPASFSDEVESNPGGFDAAESARSVEDGVSESGSTECVSPALSKRFKVILWTGLAVFVWGVALRSRVLGKHWREIMEIYVKVIGVPLLLLWVVFSMANASVPRVCRDRGAHDSQQAVPTWLRFFTNLR